MASTGHIKGIKLFVASGGELEEERRETILVLNRLGKLFPYLKIEPVLWETDLSAGSCYDKNSIQEDINPILEKCDMVLVLFFSKIGRFTLEEYRLARKKNKKTFLFFKTGFNTTDLQDLEEYKKVLEFRKETENENTLVYREYETLDRYREILKDDLAFYLKKKYPGIPPEAAEPPGDMREILYRGSRDYYGTLRGPNGRFRHLRISDIILPGTRTPWLDNNVETARTGPAQTIREALPGLWRQPVKHAVIVGPGGMGKTVSLLHWWKQLLDSKDPDKPIPVFIALNELNQVPEQERKDFIVNRIRRDYTGNSVPADQVIKVMKTPGPGKKNVLPAMVLLLDGFNEITVDKRELLLELNRLTEQCAGIQVVITSRYDMRGKFNWGHWRLLKLKELEDDQVEQYLSPLGLEPPPPGRLRKLTGNPMMLTLYAAAGKVKQDYPGSALCRLKTG